MTQLAGGYFAYTRKMDRLRQEQYRAAQLARGIKEDPNARKRQRVAVDRVFLRRLISLLKVLFPSLLCRETFQLLGLTLLLMARTNLTLRIADLTGKNAEALVAKQGETFFKGVLLLAIWAVPASMVNSGIKYLQSLLQLNFRQRLSRHLHSLYLNGMAFYRASNVGSTIDNIDQRITQDTEKFTGSFSSLYGSTFKPVVDVILLTTRLATVVGFKGPLMMYLYYFISAVLLRMIMPPFAKLTADQQRLEGDLRYAHSRLINYAEEVAFYGGGEREKNYLNLLFDKLYRHSASIFTKQATLGVFDSWLVKYGATMIGYAVVAIPVFGSLGVKMYGSAPDQRSAITRDYVRNSHILINLARAIGQLILLYKNVTQLAGYTSRVSELREVLIQYGKEEGKGTGEGQYLESDHIAFEGVSIISPDNIVLLEDLNFVVKPGMNTLIVGPNGCGKSSLFRILSGLWPLRKGKVTRPKPTDMFYIPQRPYLTAGTLRQQIIYPHSEEDMRKRGVTDDDLLKLMEEVEMRYLVDREGWNKELDWNETLSQGEQQRIAMARLFYHSPKYAILDECTSNLSLEIEAFLYQRCNELGITLITIAHRKSLWKYHQMILLMSGVGTYVHRPLEPHEVSDQDDNQGFTVPKRTK